MQVLDFGSLELDRAVMSFGLSLAGVEDQHRQAEWASIPLYGVLVETDSARILFDTGMHPDPDDRWAASLLESERLVANEDQFLAGRLAQLGLGPERIDIAVLSHLHMDHSGGVELLSNADVIVHREELRHALEQYVLIDGDTAYVKEDVAGWIGNQIRWSPLEQDEDNWEIVPGVTVINFGPGHTEGDLGLRIELPESGPLVLASDACYSSLNLGPPPVLPGTSALYDSRGMVRAARRLAQFHKIGAEIWFGHDAEQYKKLAKAPEAHYS
ncbi:MAG TPA: N-acyl homoserine lactonase family protein [Acidimicrobiales bacterium]|nr:N-acyl homoserine lactonase family protein [Acidimicrobiales bacterium]